MLEITNFDDAIGPVRLILRSFGAWPDPDRPDTLFDNFRFLTILFTMVYFANISQTIMLFRFLRDLNSVIEILSVDDIPIFLSVVKFFSVWYNRRVLKHLIVSMVKDWQNTHLQLDLKTMKDKAKFSKQLAVVCILLAFGTGVSQFFMTVSLQIRGTVVKPMYITSYFPYNTKITPVYQITWIGQCMATLFGSLTYCAVDGFFAALVMHLSGQLIILSNILSSSMNNYTIITNILNEQEFAQKITFIVERHDYLNRFAETIEDAFNIPFLIQILATSLSLSLQGYQLIMIISDTQASLPFLKLIHMLYFTLCFSFSLFVYCYVAEELRFASTMIESEAYNSQWHELPPKKTKLLLFFMQRSRKPLAITAGKLWEFSLELFTNILKACGGYLSMLLAIRDRLIDDS